MPAATIAEPLLSVQQPSGNEEGVKIRCLDFSDPQGCKAACDQEAATIKSHMGIYLCYVFE